MYRFITALVPSRRLAGWMVRRYMESYDGNPYLEHKKGVDRPLIHRGFAMINAKHRVRLVYAYRYVERHNLMPFGGLYRSHVLQLAHYLDVPREIIERAPSPDVIPGP